MLIHYLAACAFLSGLCRPRASRYSHGRQLQGVVLITAGAGQTLSRCLSVPHPLSPPECPHSPGLPRIPHPLHPLLCVGSHRPKDHIQTFSQEVHRDRAQDNVPMSPVQEGQILEPAGLPSCPGSSPNAHPELTFAPQCPHPCHLIYLPAPSVLSGASPCDHLCQALSGFIGIRGGAWVFLWTEPE